MQYQQSGYSTFPTCFTIATTTYGFRVSMDGERFISTSTVDCPVELKRGKRFKGQSIDRSMHRLLQLKISSTPKVYLSP